MKTNLKPRLPSDRTRGPIDWSLVHQRIQTVSLALSEESEANPHVMERIWAERAILLAQPADAEPVGSQLTLVLVRLGRELFGLPVEYILDIQPLHSPGRQITPVPRTPTWVLGVTNLRGCIFSVVDLCRYLGLPCAIEPVEGTPGTACLLLAETPDREVILAVDEVIAIETLLVWQDPEPCGLPPGLAQEYVQQVVVRSSGLVLALDLLALLRDRRLVIHEDGF